MVCGVVARGVVACGAGAAVVGTVRPRNAASGFAVVGVVVTAGAVVAVVAGAAVVEELPDDARP